MTSGPNKKYQNRKKAHIYFRFGVWHCGDYIYHSFGNNAYLAYYNYSLMWAQGQLQKLQNLQNLQKEQAHVKQ